MMTILIATRNRHKVGEIRAILGARFEFLTLNEYPGAPQAVEDADTFAGNATKKAVELARWAAGPGAAQKRERPKYVLADDSGLEVDALNGAPGVYSARFAALDREANASDEDNNAKLLRLLRDVPEAKRGGRFRCVIALATVPEGAEVSPRVALFEGACEGRIQFEASGGGGFGYDPLFVPEGHEQSFAQLGEGVKNRLSHRAKALEQLTVFFEARSATKTGA